VQSLPEPLTGRLPSVAEIEAEFEEANREAVRTGGQADQWHPTDFEGWVNAAAPDEDVHVESPLLLDRLCG
jgi:hypothetical protein